MNPNNTRTDPEDGLSELEPPYRSRGEAHLGRILDRYGIPFFYRQPLLVHGDGRHEIVKPAFTLPTYAGLVVEYADKAEDIHRGHRVYQDNGIAAVIVQPEDLQGFRGPDNLLQRIQRAAERYESLRRYPAMSGVQPSIDRYSPSRPLRSGKR